MKYTDNDDFIDVKTLAKVIGLSFPVRLSTELSEALKPNGFLAELGIQYTERIKTVLSLLKGSMLPDGSRETVPINGISFPMTIVKGPFIREDMISVKAELTEDSGKKEIVLSIVPEAE